MIEKAMVFIIVYSIWWAAIFWAMEVSTYSQQGGKRVAYIFLNLLPGVLMTLFGMAYVAWALAGRILGS